MARAKRKLDSVNAGMADDKERPISADAKIADGQDEVDLRTYLEDSAPKGRSGEVLLAREAAEHVWHFDVRHDRASRPTPR
jgi:hypothetical protein